MDAGFELKLIECLNLLDEGEQVERILARYPQEAEQLRALLEVAAALPALRIEPTEAARIDSRRAFLGQAHELREMAPPWRFWLPTRLALGLAALVLAFLFVGGAVAASSSALPNDPLYLVKRAAEDARLLLAPQADQPSLAEQFEQRRRDEIARLLGERSSADVAFDGRIEAIQPGRWMVSGLPVQVEGATPVSGTPGINARVHMQGRTENGQLRATSIQIEPGTGLPPTATPTATSAPTATAQPSATSLPTPTATATARPSATPTPRAVPTASATRPPTKVPAALPAPEPTSQPETPPTQAPPPSPEPDPEDEAEFTGTVESRDSAWRIGGATVEIDDATEIRGTINVGDPVKVRVVRFPNGRLVARRIELIESNGDSNNRSGTDDHGGGGGGGSDNGGTDDHGGGGDGGSDSGGSHANTNTTNTDDHGGGGG